MSAETPLLTLTPDAVFSGFADTSWAPTSSQKSEFQKLLIGGELISTVVNLSLAGLTGWGAAVCLATGTMGWFILGAVLCGVAAGFAWVGLASFGSAVYHIVTK